MSFKLGTNSNLIYKKINTRNTSGNKPPTSIIRLSSSSSVIAPCPPIQENSELPSGTVSSDLVHTECIEVITLVVQSSGDQSSGDQSSGDQSSGDQNIVNYTNVIDLDNQSHLSQENIDCINAPDVIDQNNKSSSDQISSDQSSSDQISSDQISGDQISGDQSSGDQSSGDQIIIEEKFIDPDNKLQLSQGYTDCINSPVVTDENNKILSTILDQGIMNKIEPSHSGLSEPSHSGLSEPSHSGLSEPSSGIQVLLTKHHIKNRIRQFKPT